MKVAIITPVPLLSKYGTSSNYHMALTHLVLDSICHKEENGYYGHFYRLRHHFGDYIILDNSIIELGSALDINQVLIAAKEIGADEIILPDVFQDGEATIKTVKEALKVLPDECPYKLMAVPQGKTLDEWLDCYFQLMEMTEPRKIDVIGIPKVTSSFITGGRAWLCNYLDQNKWYDPKVEYHLLGIWDNPIEILYESRFKWIRGVDSCIPILCGQHGIEFHEQRGLLVPRPSDPMNFHDAVDPFPHIIEANIAKILQWGNMG